MLRDVEESVLESGMCEVYHEISLLGTWGNVFLSFGFPSSSLYFIFQQPTSGMPSPQTPWFAKKEVRGGV